MLWFDWRATGCGGRGAVKPAAAGGGGPQGQALRRLARRGESEPTDNAVELGRYRLFLGGGGARWARLYAVSPAAENRNRQTMPSNWCGTGLLRWGGIPFSRP